MKVQRLIARILLLVYVGLPPLHSGAIGSDDYLLSGILGIPSPTHDQQVNLLSRTPESREASDGQPDPTTPLIPHCDFEVSPVDQPPLCLFAPPKSIRSDNDRHDSSPLFFTIAPTSPPPRHA